MVVTVNLREALNRLRKAHRSASRLVLYRGIRRDPVVHALAELLKSVLAGESLSSDPSDGIAGAYSSFFTALAEAARKNPHPSVGSPWQSHLLELVLNDENSFSRLAEEYPLEEIGESIARQAGLDLQRLQDLHALDTAVLLDVIRQVTSEIDWVGWDQLLNLPTGESSQENTRIRFKRQLHESQDWSSQLAELATVYRAFGSGIFSRFQAFHWERPDQRGHLRGIPEPDPIRLEDLIGCEDQKGWLVRNTSFFLDGCPANNVLVYGDRGTGKSSAIKL
jgi:hypothetical protein